MKYMLRTEEAAMFGLAIYLNSFLPFEGWVFWVFFLAPDIGILGYLVNPKVGSVTYNLLHHKGIAMVCYLAGYFLISYELTMAGVILFGHSSFDRMLGFGLKLPDNFKHTHLGWIGQKA
ncbi:DUF4260 domain-containing protein [Oscillatoria amoena NRMC-F 0135]|nr:DUF4260 domain-containing protein [Oscillatoria amoena NRMC-F 0135]